MSDGAKCDIARLQIMFGSGVTSAVQDPSYPVYVDTSVMFGQTGEVDANGQFNNLVYMKCPKENNFFPHLDEVPRADVYYFCSPNNPTGAVATKAQLEELVARALKDGSILVFDAAYAHHQDAGVPTSDLRDPRRREVRHRGELVFQVRRLYRCSVGLDRRPGCPRVLGRQQGPRRF